MKILRAVCALLLSLPLLGRPAAAQTPTSGVLEGTVLDAAGAPLPEAQVTIQPAGGGATQRVVTARSGGFRVPLLPPGEYSVLVERLGFQPVIVTRVPIRASRSVGLEVRVEPVSGAVTTPQAVVFEGVSGVSLPGASEVFGATALAMVQPRRGDAAELMRLSARGDTDLSVEGLPARYTALVIDGLPFRPALHPLLAEPGLAGMVEPLNGLQQADLFAGGLDVQSRGLGGAVLNLTTRPGGGAQHGGATASWVGLGNDALPEGHRELRGAFELGASLLDDSAQVRVFGNVLSTETALPRWGPDDEAARAALSALLGGDSLVQAGVFAAERARVQLGGRFDWQPAEGQALGVTALYATAGGDGIPAELTGFRPDERDAQDLAVVATYDARLGGGFATNVHVGFGSSTREYGLPGGADSPAAGVVVGAQRIGVGPGAALPGRFVRNDVQAQVTGMLESGAHLLQAGIGAAFASHEMESAYASAGLFTFGEAADVTALEGTFFRTLGRTPVADFGTRTIHAFVQDRWTVAPGFEMVTGGRFSAEFLPSSEILPDTDWQTLTGMDNTNVPERVDGFGAGASFTWNVRQRHRWLVRGDLTVQSGEIAPELLAEALTVDGRQEVVRALGAFTAFPQAPEGTTLRRLTLLDPELAAPLTVRGSFGIATQVAPHTSLLLGAAIRQTRNLPRRIDLNLVTEALAHDQFGRGIYGGLERRGSLIAATPGTGRRFLDYDVVSALRTDATSSYWGVSAGIERRTGGSLDLLASYTYSRTTDELLAGADGFAPAPFAERDATTVEWQDGTSDYDVPHRLVLGATLRVPGLEQVRLGGTFRYQSGRPFTPGFEPGVDANGDGIVGNDPAFIDDALEGMDALLRSWDCLRSDAGRLAERNACRAEAERSLNLRLAAGLLSREALGIDVVLEALDLAASGGGWYDTALYRVDSEGAEDFDAADGTITLPLAANPRFGERILDAFQPARLRLGVHVRF